MENHRIEKSLNQIISGYLKFKHKNLLFKIMHPTVEAKCESDNIYQEVLYECQLSGLYTDNELLRFLYKNGLWSDDKENKIEGIKKDIEEFKVKMYELTLKKNEMEIARKALRIAEFHMFRLLKEKHSYDYISARGCAKIAKENYLLLSSVRDSDNNLIFKNVIDEPMNLLIPIVSFYQKHRVSDKDIRTISKSEQWKMLWSLNKSPEKIFNKAILDMTDEQKALCAFARFYDNVYESHECPHESIINDDDLLDGWLIVQKRKRDKEHDVKLIDDKISPNEKIRNADEVYVITDDKEIAKKIDNMNDIGAKIIKEQRMNTVKARGIVNELDMPDVKQRLVSETQAKILSRLKGGK